MSQHEHLVVERRGAVLELRLNRPESRNAFSLQLLRALHEEVSTAWDHGHRAIVLTGAGPIFSAGGDIKFARELLADPERNDPVWEELMATFGKIVVGLRETPCLSVAAIQGSAVGAGMSLALATDVRVMAEHAALLPVWLDKGAVPDGGGSFFLSRALTPDRMFRMALHAQPVSSEEALALGLVDEVVPADGVLPRANELADQLVTRSGEALVALRRLSEAAGRSSLAEQVALETDELRILRKRAERRAALSLDQQTRPPGHVSQ